MEKSDLFGKDLAEILPKLKEFYKANTKDCYKDVYWHLGDTGNFLAELEKIVCNDCTTQ